MTPSVRNEPAAPTEPDSVIVPGWAWRAIETLHRSCITFAREAGAYMDAIDESSDAGEDAPSERFDAAIREADVAIAAASTANVRTVEADGAIYQCMAIVGDGHDNPNLWMDHTREDFERLRTQPGVRSRVVYARAANDGPTTELWLRPSDVYAINRAKESGAEMVSVLGHLQPQEGWPVRMSTGSGAPDAAADGPWVQVTNAPEPRKHQLFTASRDVMPEGVYYLGASARDADPPGVAIPEGWALVPKQMTLTADALGHIETMCAGPDNEGIGGAGGEDRWCEGILWVGETIGDQGEKYYGLNIACSETIDEGSVPIALFDRVPPATGVAPAQRSGT